MPPCARHAAAPCSGFTGLTNRANPVVLLVPFHLVIDPDASLIGYGGGLPRKAWLLRHETGMRGELVGNRRHSRGVGGTRGLDAGDAGREVAQSSAASR